MCDGRAVERLDVTLYLPLLKLVLQDTGFCVIKIPIELVEVR